MSLSRRRFVTHAAAGALLLGSRQLLAQGLSDPVPVASEPTAAPSLRSNQLDLQIGYQPVNFTGQTRLATTVNGSLPAPILRWREGDTVQIRVHNQLAVPSSIHWHGLILPSEMDGVPGLSFAGIPPGGYFDYRFTLRQSGTYWYHSHSGYQEQTGLYGAIVIEPREPDPVPCDREHVLLLSDWSDTAPEQVEANLLRESHYYNRQERTLGDLWREIRARGVAATWADRQMWNQMRMSDRDISDVTGATYTFLMNGVTPEPGWLGLFKPGERVRLRVINAAAMTLFDLRIPGLKLTVVGSDGQAVQPVAIDELRIGVAETYDLLVEPEDQPYCVFAQAIDRSGFACGTLTPHPSRRAERPALDPMPILTHRDMGMGGTHSGHAAPGRFTAAQPMMGHHHHHGMAMPLRQPQAGAAGLGSVAPIVHPGTERGVQVDMQAMAPPSGLQDPGIGLREHAERYGRRVLTYADLRNRYPTLDRRQPERELQLHLTGNMHRYLWSFDGVPYHEAEPLVWRLGERLRITLVNDTMMTHPIHLHGMWSELETGDPEFIPRKHTVLVQPGSTISYLVTADARGRWAYHCHLLYHMMGMMREVQVR